MQNLRKSNMNLNKISFVTKRMHPNLNYSQSDSVTILLRFMVYLTIKEERLRQKLQV